MFLYSRLLLASASLASAWVIRRADPPFQNIPATAQADNTFNNGAPDSTSFPDTSDPVPDVYGARSIDLPFGRLYHGNMKFFAAGQLNTPENDTDLWYGEPNVVDSATQSACGIPDNAFSISKVAIHPYFLKYADLSRYCMQDVCISFWNGKQAGEGQSDMMLKVTDICSTDPNDPTHCQKPGDIKVDRTKVKIMEQIYPGPTDSYPELNGSEYTAGEAWWFFTKCWADALVQPAYKDNWFATPALPNNLNWSQTTVTQQMVNNNISYPQHDPAWSKYPVGAYNPQYNDYISPPITDWDPSQPDPIWCPVAGGKGWGKPTGDCGGSSSTNTSGEFATGSGPAAEPNAQSAPASASTTTPVQTSPVQSTPPSSTTPGSIGSGSPWNGTSGAQEQPDKQGIVANKQGQGVGGSLSNEPVDEDDTCEP